MSQETRQGASVSLQHLNIIRAEAAKRGMKIHTFMDKIIEAGLKRFDLTPEVDQTRKDKQ